MVFTSRDEKGRPGRPEGRRKEAMGRNGAEEGKGSDIERTKREEQRKIRGGGTEPRKEGKATQSGRREEEGRRKRRGEREPKEMKEKKNRTGQTTKKGVLSENVEHTLFLYVSFNFSTLRREREEAGEEGGEEGG